MDARTTERLTRRRLLRLVGGGASGAALGLALAACAPQGGTAPQAQPKSEPKADAKPKADAQPAAQTPAKAGSGKVTLDMWTHFAGKNLEVMNGLLEEFKREHTDVDFRVNPVGAGEILTKVLAAVSAGAPPDIYHSPAWVPPDMASNGILAPLDEAVKLPVELLKNFDEITIYGGRRYGVPANGGLGAMAYNKALLDAAGVSKSPETWDELIDVAKKTTRAEEGQWGTILPNKPEVITAQTIWSLFQSNGVDILNDGKEIAFNTPEGVEAFQFGTELVQTLKVSPVKSYGQLDTWNDYGTGKVGSVNLYPAWLSNIKTFPFQSVTAQMPKRKGPGSQFAGNYWTLPATNVGNGKLEAFARFCEWWSRPENNARWCRDTGALPTSKATVDHEIYQKFLQDEPNARPYVDSIPYARPFPGIVGVTGVLQLVAEGWEAAVLGKSSPKEALDRAAKRASDELKRAQRG